MFRARPLAFAAVLLVAGPLAAGPPGDGEPAAGGPPDLLRLIPADAVQGAVIDVDRLRGEPPADRLLEPPGGPGGLFAGPLGALGLEFAQVAAVAVFLPPAEPENPDPYGSPVGDPVVLIRCRAAVTAPAGAVARGLVRPLPDGRTLAVAGGPRALAAVAALGGAAEPAAGSPAGLLEEVAAERSAGERAADGRAPAVRAFWDVTAMRGVLLDGFDQASHREEEWLPAYGLARPAVVHADAYALAADLAGGQLSATLTADAPDAAAAGRLRRTADAAATLGENLLDALPGVMLRRDPGRAAAVVPLAVGLRAALGAREVTREGTRVRVAARADPDVTAAAADLLAGALAAGVRPRPPAVREGRFPGEDVLEPAGIIEER